MADEVAEADSEDLRSFSLTFQSFTCDICDDQGHVARTCRCGDFTSQPDEHVLKRQSMTPPLLARLTAPVHPTSPIELEEVLDALSGWIEDLFAGLDTFSGPDPDIGALTVSVDRLLTLRHRAAAVPRLRPSLAIWDPLRDVLDSLATLAVRELEVCESETPDDAQVAQAAGQVAIDEAAVAIGVMGRRLDQWGVERSLRMPDRVVTAAAGAYEATGATGLLDLDSQGRALYERIVGPDKEPPSGMGVGLLVELGQIDQAFDVDRVFRVAGTVYRRLTDNPDQVKRLLGDPVWRSNLLHARQTLFDAQLKTVTVLRALIDERRLEVEAVLELGGKLTERVSQELVALIVAADPRVRVRPNQKWTAVHAAARKASLNDLLLGFDDRIRNVDAHVDFEAEDGFVVLHRHRATPDRIADDVLVDLVLSAVESCASMLAGIDVALVELGHASSMDAFNDLTTENRVAVILAASGIEQEEVRVDMTEAKIVGSLIGQVPPRPFAVVASLRPYLPDSVNEIRLTLRTPEGFVDAVAPLGPLRRMEAGADQVQRDVAFLEFGSAARANGKPLLTRTHVRKFVAVKARAHEVLPLVDVAGEIAAYRALAMALRDTELVQAVDALLSFKRLREGRPGAKVNHKALGRLDTYRRLAPPSMNDGSTLQKYPGAARDTGVSS